MTKKGARQGCIAIQPLHLRHGAGVGRAGAVRAGSQAHDTGGAGTLHGGRRRTARGAQARCTGGGGGGAQARDMASGTAYKGVRAALRYGTTRPIGRPRHGAGLATRARPGRCLCAQAKLWLCTWCT